jgi:hypothetical protein
MATEGQAPTRAGRCANHPAVARVGACALCGRPLCVACAVPVRGQIIGPECLSKVLVDPPPPVQIPAVIPARAGQLIAAGFGLVLIASAFPWSRFGVSSRFFGAWTSRWPFLAVGAAAVGLFLVILDRYRPVENRLGTLALFLLAVISLVAAVTAHRSPPLLSESTAWPLVAAGGAAVALAGVLIRVVSLSRAGREPPVGSLG